MLSDAPLVAFRRTIHFFALTMIDLGARSMAWSPSRNRGVFRGNCCDLPPGLVKGSCSRSSPIQLDWTVARFVSGISESGRHFWPIVDIGRLRPCTRFVSTVWVTRFTRQGRQCFGTQDLLRLRSGLIRPIKL